MRIPKGMAGVIVVMLALMGSIGAGYLLNGGSAPVVVEDYNYITDVSGLYDYTTVPAYATYNPAQNNYQYSSSLTDLGTYTSGINFSRSESANLNPIITPASGLQTESSSIPYKIQNYSNSSPVLIQLNKNPGGSHHLTYVAGTLYADGATISATDGYIILCDKFSLSHSAGVPISTNWKGGETQSPIQTIDLHLEGSTVSGTIWYTDGTSATKTYDTSFVYWVFASGSYTTNFYSWAPYIKGQYGTSEGIAFGDTARAGTGTRPYISYDSGSFVEGSSIGDPSITVDSSLVNGTSNIRQLHENSIHVTYNDGTSSVSYVPYRYIVPISVNTYFPFPNSIDGGASLEDTGELIYKAESPRSVAIGIKYIRVDEFVNWMGGSIQSIRINTPTTTLNWPTPAGINGAVVQNIGIAMDGGTSIVDAINNQVTGYFAPGGILTTAPTQNIGTMTTPVGVISNLTINANQTLEYDYTRGGTTSHVIKNTNECYLYIWHKNEFVYPTHTDVPLNMSYTMDFFVGVEYLDPTQGVSLSGSAAYWSNDFELGAASFLFKKPISTGSYQFTSFDSSNNQLNSWTIRFDQTWYLTYSTDAGSTTVNLGSSWPAMMVTEYYTGELSTTPVKSFTNFTAYRLSNTRTYDTDYSGNVSIDHYRIMKSGTAMSMAAVDTTVLNGTVPGAMFDASFNAANYFPNEENIRIAFDSAAYVGSNVTVGTWTMDVDSVAFSGTFEINGTPYKVDLTQPWSLTWNEDGTVSIEFTESKRSGARSVTILDERVTPAVELGGQWAIDTDAYSVSSHVEDQYDFNFGHFGLDKTTFVVCCMGLTAIIAIAFKLGRVEFGLIDFIVLFGANAILWMVL